MDIADLQRNIKRLLKELGWSQKELARKIYAVRNDIDDEDEIERFEESLKKQLKRTTTDPELLQSYLNIIFRQPQFINQKTVMHEYIESGALPGGVSGQLRQISFSLTEELLEEEQKEFLAEE